jgi:uncharacterized membrane protein YoaK (UPF0700 family)
VLAVPAKVATLHDPLARALLALTFATGLVDAVSYLGLGRVFTANMTGNVVLLGFGLAGGTGLPVLAPIVSLAAFLVGAGCGGRLGPRLAAALTIEVGVLAAATIAALAIRVRAGEASGDLLIALLAFGMGVRNATVRKLGVPDLTTTVLTMTLTGLAADSPLAGGSGAGTTRRVAAAGAMLVGALVGALLLQGSVALALGATTVVSGATLAVVRSSRR